MEDALANIHIYRKADGTSPFYKWYWGLKDKKTQAIIDYRLNCVEAGTLGDSKLVGDGVFELRIHHGSGIRLYYARVGERVLLLLCGSRKSDQQSEIQKAKRYLKDYQDRLKGS
ncbi:MAG: type II toxin-antitoxin system RelE/ParE family toxin [Candidatus Melainabacteria bacterium]